MQYNENLSEALAVLAQLAPVSLSTAAHAVGPFNASGFRRILAVINIGVLGSSGTVDAKFQTSATSGGSYADVAGTSITQITAGATNLILLEIKAESLGNLGTGAFLKLVITPGTAASMVSAEVFGTNGNYPSSDYNVVAPSQTLVV